MPANHRLVCYIGMYVAIHVKDVDYVKTETVTFVKNCCGKSPILDVYF